VGAIPTCLIDAVRNVRSTVPIAIQYSAVFGSNSIMLTSSRAGSPTASKLLASWIAANKPNSVTLSSSLAGRRPSRKRARELDTVVEFGLNGSSLRTHCEGLKIDAGR